ncbi:hypothetical protein PMAYCL1PPCAC_23418, partial [Pristionchus mayeri]
RPLIMSQPKEKHPSYAAMITQTITELKEKKGSTKPAIVKQLAAAYDIDSKIAGKYVGKALLKGLYEGVFVLSDGVGLKGRFKLPQVGNAPEKRKSAISAAAALPPSASVRANLPTVAPKKKKAAKTGNAPAPKKAAKSPKKDTAAKPSKKTPAPKKMMPKGKKAKKASQKKAVTTAVSVQPPAQAAV